MDWSAFLQRDAQPSHAGREFTPHATCSCDCRPITVLSSLEFEILFCPLICLYHCIRTSKYECISFFEIARWRIEILSLCALCYAQNRFLRRSTSPTRTWQLLYQRSSGTGCAINKSRASCPMLPPPEIRRSFFSRLLTGGIELSRAPVFDLVVADTREAIS